MINILALIISYNPDMDIINNVKMLISEGISEVLIIDNASNKDKQELLHKLSLIKKVHLVSNNENLGIATALNQGLRYAQEKEYKWIATFDQDSKITPQYFLNMYDTFCQQNDNSIALISPIYVDAVTLEPYEKVTSTSPRRLETTMTSGNLVAVEAAVRVGGYRDELFIDYVDHEFCLRLNQCGYSIMESPLSILRHNLGNIEKHKFLSKEVSNTNHNYLRRYYMSRNRIFIYKKYGMNKWMYNDLKSFFYEIFKIILFEKDKWKKLKCTIVGIIHGLNGRMGRYSG